MSYSIEVSEKTFSSLQQLAKPFIDTPDDVIQRLLSVYFETTNQRAEDDSQVENEFKPIFEVGSNLQDATEVYVGNKGTNIFNPDSPPNLTHTSSVRGNIDGIEVRNWNELLSHTHAYGLRKLNGDFEALQRISAANLKKGEFTGAGFKPVGKLGFSIQGVEANRAWLFSYYLAKKLSFPISVEFRWQQKEGAAYPGEAGRISWNP